MKLIRQFLLAGLILSLLAACIKAEQAPTQTSETIAIPSVSTAEITGSIPTVQPVLASTPNVSQVTPWWNDTVFYEVFVRSFKDSDGDGVGDINGLIEKLDYLNDGDPTTTTDLGITGIWLMPITESPAYHGYDVVDYYSVDKEYGTREDFVHLMEEAHKRGIRVIVDLVLNHTGKDHPWFVESRKGNPNYRDWYIWSDIDPGYRGPDGKVVWISDNGIYYYSVFRDGKPDLNLRNPEVTDELYKITRFWIQEMKVDGFRLDAIKHLIEVGRVQENTLETHTWLQAFHANLKTLSPSAFTVGEAWTSTDQIVDYTGDEVDIAFEFELAKTFLTAAKGPIAASLKERMQLVLDSFPAGQFGVFLANHDQDRVMSVLKDEKKAKLAATMMLTAPGVPFIYYGEEIGMLGVKPDEDIRLPMQWTAETPGAGFTTVNPWRAPAQDYFQRNVAAQAANSDSLLNHYKQLIRLRNQYAGLRTGESVLVDTGTQRLYGLLRYNDQEAFLILVNVHPKPLQADLYSLTLNDGPFTGPLQAVSVLGPENPSSPVITPSGGFSNYTPFQEIPPHTSVIIRLVH